jgi:hypothetical protein
MSSTGDFPGRSEHQMNILLRRYAEWKGKRKAAQIIIFDGAAEIEKTQAFGKGALAGALVATLMYILIAPGTLEPSLMEEIAQRDQLLHEANQRAEEAMQLTGLCLNTAHGIERTLETYQRLLGR